MADLEWTTTDAEPDVPAALVPGVLVKVEGVSDRRFLYVWHPTYIVGFMWLDNASGVGLNMKVAGTPQLTASLEWMVNMTDPERTSHLTMILPPPDWPPEL